MSTHKETTKQVNTFDGDRGVGNSNPYMNEFPHCVCSDFTSVVHVDHKIEMASQWMKTQGTEARGSFAEQGNKARSSRDW